MFSIELDNFDINSIMDSGQCFRMEKVDNNTILAIALNKAVYITQEGKVVTFHCSDKEFLSFWMNYFDIDNDYGRYIEAVNPRDKYLMEAVKVGQGIRILNQDLWEMIVSFLISQQNNIPRIKKSITKICEVAGEKKIDSRGKEYYSFPTPEGILAMGEEGLKECGLGYRAKYVYKAALDIKNGDKNLDEIRNMSPKQAKEALLEFFGIGNKVSDCICLFALHTLDAFPIDTHILQVLEKHYKRGFPNKRYKGFRGVIQQYIFFYELYLIKNQVENKVKKK